jgi:hypothetical protein
MAGQSWFYLEFRTTPQRILPSVRLYMNMQDTIIFSHTITNVEKPIIPLSLNFKKDLRINLDTLANIPFSINWIDNNINPNRVSMFIKINNKMIVSLVIEDRLKLNLNFTST